MSNCRAKLAALLAVVCVGALPATAAGPGASPAPEAPPAEPSIQISGRVLHTWLEKPGLRVILVIDGFTVLTTREQITAHDGVVWFNEEQAGKSRKVGVGIYAETGVEHRRPDGTVARYDSVYLEIENGRQLSLHSSADLPLKGKADEAPLYLRARKRQSEFLAGGPTEAPEAVEAAEPSEPPPPVPGVREAGVPREVTIVPRDELGKVHFTSRVVERADPTGETRTIRVSVWTGGVYVMRGDMEMAADQLVLWSPVEAVEAGITGEGEPGGTGRRYALEAYFEGHVQLNLGHRTLRASQLYYDFRNNRALAVDTKIKTFSRARNVPVYVYAEEVRQLSEGLFVGKDASLTTDQFGVPNYDVHAETLTLIDLTPQPVQEAQEEVSAEEEDRRRVRFKGEDVTFRVRRVPLGWMPGMAGTLAEGETALRTIRFENATNRGTGILTQWHLFRLLGLDREPRGFDFYLNADGWSERGGALGVESDYRREDFYGEFLSYYIHDLGKDSVGGDSLESPHRDRGRVRWQHRQYLPNNWELTLEFSYISDHQFLNEFYEREDEEGKAQETLVYLKRPLTDDAGLPTEQAVTILASWRINDFFTQTEYQPQVAYHVIGHSLWEDRLTYFQHSEFAVARYRPSDQLASRRQTEVGTLPAGPSTSQELLADTAHELDLPIRLGPVTLVPFYEGRVSWFGKDLERDARWRFGHRMGSRAALTAWKVFPNARNEMWGVDGVRHVQTFDVEAYARDYTAEMHDLIPYDVTGAGRAIWQGVNDVGVTALGWRHRFQTKRGPPDERQTVDFLTVDLETFFYHGRDGPFPIARDGKRAWNHVDLRTDWRMTDSAGLWSDTNYNTEKGYVDFFAVGFDIVHTPRLSYSLGHRYIHEDDVSRSFLAADYRINQKWSLEFSQHWEWNDMENAQSRFMLTRRMNRWLMRLEFHYDPGEDEQFVGVEIQPMGLPEIRFGS